SADLVVIGHRGVNERFSSGLLGSTAEAVARKCPRPLFISPMAFRELKHPVLSCRETSKFGHQKTPSAAKADMRNRIPGLSTTSQAGEGLEITLMEAGEGQLGKLL